MTADSCLHCEPISDSSIQRKLCANSCCKSFGQLQPHFSFHKNSGKRDGLESWCKECVLKQKKKKLKERSRQRRVICSFKGCNFDLQPETMSFIEVLRPILEGL